MTGDRRLTDEEKRLFIEHKVKFLDKVKEKGGEPTLYDAFFIEILANLAVYEALIVEMGAKIALLETRGETGMSEERSGGLNMIRESLNLTIKEFDAILGGHLLFLQDSETHEWLTVCTTLIIDGKKPPKIGVEVYKGKLSERQVEDEMYSSRLTLDEGSWITFLAWIYSAYMEKKKNE